jgi:hypothetical protein
MHRLLAAFMVCMSTLFIVTRGKTQQTLWRSQMPLSYSRLSSPFVDPQNLWQCAKYPAIWPCLFFGGGGVKWLQPTFQFIPLISISIFTINQQTHYSDSLLFHSTAATCFDVCTSSSGSFLLCVLLSYIKNTCRFMVYAKVFTSSGCG